MDQLNVHYKAFADYRKNTAENKDIEKTRREIAKANIESDKIEIIKTECVIEEDWIVAIEKGLEHIEKAIKEERQFIRSNGEVVLIEKVKNVSKESVEHLARHSNLITKIKDGDDIIPDELYTVERLSDFTVYENRFLYMLLCYLRDFITFRYDKIVELTNTYNGSLNIRKTVMYGGKRAIYEIKLNEEQKNDEYLSAHNPIKDKIDRIDGLLKTVLLFLSFPLMEEVSKAPKLKPPITETNVLKMNKNFKGAMELYYFINAYDKPGYTARRTTEVLSPFGEKIADRFAEAINLLSFLTYEHGLRIEPELKEQYEEEEKERKKEEQRKKLEQIKKLRKRIQDSGETAEEYMLLLEQRNRKLEEDSVQLAVAKQQITELTENVARLTEEGMILTNNIEGYKREIADIHKAHEAEIADIGVVHAREISDLKESFEVRVGEINVKHSEDIREITAKHSEDIREINSRHESDVSERNKAHAREISDMRAEYDAKAALMQDELKAEQEQNAAIKAERDKLEDIRLNVTARYNALRRQTGEDIGEDEFVSEEDFNDLEMQYRSIKTLFKEQWRKTKKKIRREVLHGQAPKPDDDLEDGLYSDSTELNAQNTDEAILNEPAKQKSQKKKQSKKAEQSAAQEELWQAQEQELKDILLQDVIEEIPEIVEIVPESEQDE